MISGESVAIVFPVVDVFGEILRYAAADGVNVSHMLGLDPLRPNTHALCHIANGDHGVEQHRRWAAKTAPSAARDGQPERCHLHTVAGQQEVADQYRVVPGLALERREPRE